MSSLTINKIIKDIEVKKLKDLYGEFNNVIELISKFIIKKNLILYGGLVINLLLPKKHRFYKEYTINDYDCFSKNPVEDAYELANLIKKSGYKYIKIKKAIHNNTYKISVFGKQFFDITFLDPDIYDILLNNIKNNQKSLKYYKDQYKIIPIELVKQNLYFELARPIQSGFRWEKIYNRMELVNKFYPTEKSVEILKCIPIKKEYSGIVKVLLEYIKNNKIPIIDSYSIKIYNDCSYCCYRLTENSIYITILVKNIIESFNNIKNILNINKSIYDIKVLKKGINAYNLYREYDIKIINKNTKQHFNIVRIIEIKNQCFSITAKNNFILGSIDTCLYFLYYNYVKNKIYYNNNSEAGENIYYINQYENNISDTVKNNINDRLKKNCFGDIDYEDELKNIWNKRLTLEYL
jgi:hypothetical protein